MCSYQSAMSWWTSFQNLWTLAPFAPRWHSTFQRARALARRLTSQKPRTEPLLLTLDSEATSKVLHSKQSEALQPQTSHPCQTMGAMQLGPCLQMGQAHSFHRENCARSPISLMGRANSALCSTGRGSVATKWQVRAVALSIATGKTLHVLQ